MRPKIFIPAVRVKTANLTLPKFPSAPFFELAQRKVHKIEKFKKGHKCKPKIFFQVENSFPAIRIKMANLT